MTTEQTIFRFQELIDRVPAEKYRRLPLAYALANFSLAKAIKFLERMEVIDSKVNVPKPKPPVNTGQLHPSYRPVHKPNPMCYGYKPFGMLYGSSHKQLVDYLFGKR